MLKEPYSSSLLSRITFRTGILIKAIKRVAAALVPPELEKISINSPKKKLSKINELSIFFKGYKKTKII
jgi:hypothetical protein